MTSHKGGLGILGWSLAAIVLAACFAMIGVGIAGLRDHERATLKPIPSRTFIPTYAESPPRTLGWDLTTVSPRTGNAGPVATLTGNQWNGERSPDGRRLLFAEHPGPDVPSQISVLESDGTVQQLTHLQRGAMSPTWSPDGRWIAFVATGAEGRDIFVMRADGSGLGRLTGTPLPDFSPGWSPDGKRIVFQSGWGTTSAASTIWMASFPGGRARQITSGADADQYPTWSPDGARILFLRWEFFKNQLEIADSDLFLMRPDGTSEHRLVTDEGPLPSDPFSSYEEWGINSADNHYQDAPTWSPNGRLVAYSGGHCDCITIVDVARGTILWDIPGDFTDLSWGIEGIVASYRG